VLQRLGKSQLDAAFGLVGLASLYFIRWSMGRLTQRYPRFCEPLAAQPLGITLTYSTARTFFFMNVMRNGMVVIILTIA